MNTKKNKTIDDYFSVLFHDSSKMKVMMMKPKKQNDIMNEKDDQDNDEKSLMFLKPQEKKQKEKKIANHSNINNNNNDEDDDHMMEILKLPIKRNVEQIIIYDDKKSEPKSKKQKIAETEPEPENKNEIATSTNMNTILHSPPLLEIKLQDVIQLTENKIHDHIEYDDDEEEEEEEEEKNIWLDSFFVVPQFNFHHDEVQAIINWLQKPASPFLLVTGFMGSGCSYSIRKACETSKFYPYFYDPFWYEGNGYQSISDAYYDSHLAEMKKLGKYQVRHVVQQLSFLIQFTQPPPGFDKCVLVIEHVEMDQGYHSVMDQSHFRAIVNTLKELYQNPHACWPTIIHYRQDLEWQSRSRLDLIRKITWPKSSPFYNISVPCIKIQPLKMNDRIILAQKAFPSIPKTIIDEYQMMLASSNIASMISNFYFYQWYQWDHFSDNKKQFIQSVAKDQLSTLDFPWDQIKKIYQIPSYALLDKTLTVTDSRFKQFAQGASSSFSLLDSRFKQFTNYWQTCSASVRDVYILRFIGNWWETSSSIDLKSWFSLFSDITWSYQLRQLFYQLKWTEGTLQPCHDMSNIDEDDSESISAMVWYYHLRKQSSHISNPSCQFKMDSASYITSKESHAMQIVQWNHSKRRHLDFIQHINERQNDKLAHTLHSERTILWTPYDELKSHLPSSFQMEKLVTLQNPKSKKKPKNQSKKKDRYQKQRLPSCLERMLVVPNFSV